MAEWTVVALETDGARAWRVDLTDAESDVKVVSGERLSVLVEGGRASILGGLTSAGPFYPLNDLQGVALSGRRDCLEGIAERVHAIKVVGAGTVTLYAVRRG